MRIVISIVLVIVFSLPSCDYQGCSSSFVKNTTLKEIEIRFQNTSYDRSESNPQTVTIPAGEEKKIRTIWREVNSTAHNCLQVHDLSYLDELIFDVYINEKKVDSQIWLPENWIYEKIDDWEENYRITITPEMCNLRE
jgi:hypothetical protein